MVNNSFHRIILNFFGVSAILLLSTSSIRAQIERSILEGTITEEGSKQSIPGVLIIQQPAGTVGTQSDASGNYRLETMSGTLEFVYKALGYEQVTRKVELLPGKVTRVDVVMKPSFRELKTFVTSASKYEQNIEQLTISMEVLKPNIIENKNTTSMEEALQQVPGVSIVDNEAQIRSGSGYSFGAGSRVMIMVDDLPIMSGDAGRPSWGFLPLENVEQVEVIKGASSVLYGSAALNGVVNIRTAYPKEKPETKISMFSGIYNNPRSKEAVYWGKNNPAYTSMSFLHSRRIGQLDLVVGGNVFSDEGYIGPPPVNPNSPDFNPLAEQRGEYEKRARLNLGLRWRDKKVEGLSYGVNTNMMLSHSAGALIWFNADSGLYRSYPGAITQTLQDVFYVDPYVNYFGKRGSRHVIRNRMFYLNNNNDNSQSNTSRLYFSEYQFQRSFTEGFLKGLSFTTGVVHQYSEGTSDLYKGNLGDTGGKQAKSDNRNIAGYAQAEYSWKERVTLSAGARYEHFEINGPRVSPADSFSTVKEGRPVFRSGLNVKLHKATFLRASYGQGYRFPTIAEKFIRTAVGPVRIYPNDSLKSETSWSAEFGIKQGFRIASFQGYLDLAVFRQQYQDNIEFNFGLFGSEFTVENFFGLGFASINVGRTRVDGAEATLIGTGKIGKVGINLLTGYTYTMPIALDPDLELNYVGLGGDKVSYKRTSSDTTNNILKYRFQHLMRADVELTYGKFSLGMSTRYNSYMQNIDKVFFDLDEFGILPSGLIEFNERVNKKGVWVFDARLGYQVTEETRISFVVNNLTNAEYSLRPLVMQPPRTTALQVMLRF